MNAYVFPAIHANKARHRVDDCNITEPSMVLRGPHAGKMFIETALSDREPRWISRFQSLIANPNNNVELVDLVVEDKNPIQFS